MDIKDFIANFASILEETEVNDLAPETNFRQLDEWDSLEALAVLNMVAKKYDVKLPIQEMRMTNTIQELFDLVDSKK